MGNLKDYATSTVLTAPSPATSGTSLVVQAGHGARFPATPFFATIHPPSEFPTMDNAEKIQVTAISTDTLTIVRAQGGTTARTVEAGWRISNALFLSDIPVVSSTTVDAAGAVMNSDTSTAGMSFVVDEDNMASNSDTKLATQQSIKAYVDSQITAVKQALLPVGSIVVLGVSTNPNTLYGFGTWTAITDRVIVGKGSSGTFATLDATGGAETHTLSINEMPAHSHPNGYRDFGACRPTYASDPSWATILYNANYGGFVMNTDTRNTGGGAAHNNLQPYIVKYIWQRTA